ncbi:MAG: flagellar motor stator protein MotA [Methylococcaceae bacterium]|nr:flagellar motor stator protein MotA [Methylococcaceae bacterium]
MFVIIGYILVFGAVIGGFMASGGHPAVLIQPFEMLIIFGSALGAFVSGNSFAMIKKTLAAATSTLKSSTQSKAYYSELVLSFFTLSQKIRKEGLLSLEEVIENPDNANIFTPNVLADKHIMDFISDNLRLLVIGIEEHQLEELMDQALEVHHEDGQAPIKAVQRISDAMPAFGIVGAVMGVVHAMESLHLPPAELGKLIAAALVGTFLGILVSYGFISPVAAVMEDRLEAEGNALKCVQKGIMCCSRGISPPMTAEYMRAMISSPMRPSFLELEAQLKAAKE